MILSKVSGKCREEVFPIVMAEATLLHKYLLEGGGSLEKWSPDPAMKSVYIKPSST